MSINGYARFADLRVAAGLIWRDNGGSATAPRSNLWYVGALYTATHMLQIDGEAFRLFIQGQRQPRDAFRGARDLQPVEAHGNYATLGHVAIGGRSALSVSGGAPGSDPRPGPPRAAWPPACAIRSDSRRSTDSAAAPP